MKIRNAIYFLSLSLVLCMAGCSDKVKVSGNVSYPDGAPVKRGSVCFKNEKATYFGRLNEQGNYAPGEVKDGQGIPSGRYVVWLAGTEEPKNGDEDTLIPTVASRFTSPDESILALEIERGAPVVYDIVVEKP